VENRVADVQSILEAWDGEDVIIRFDRPTGSWIIIAVHSTALGPAGGGTRMKTYPDLAAAVQDALNLAEGMTHKFAVAELPRGGGKAVIAVPPELDQAERRALLLRYGTLISQLGGLYYTGPDVGTSSADMDIIAEAAPGYAFGRSPERGGSGDSGPPTALGVLQGIKTTCRYALGSDDLTGRCVVVQGAGSVGGRLLELLQEAGADLLFTDTQEATVQQMRAKGFKYIPPEVVYDTPCDIFAPCAMGGTLNQETIPVLRCRGVAGSANNQLAEPADAERLRARGILYAPDYVINVGGAISLLGRELLGWSQEQTEARIIHTVSETLNSIFELAKADDITTAAAAQRVVDRRLKGGLRHDDRHHRSHH
jgi:leucine dehydrogenase